MKKGFKYEIAPNEEQIKYLNNVFGSTRFVYNHTLALTIEKYNESKEDPLLKKPNVSSTGLTYLAKPLREEFEFLKEVSSVAIQQKLMDLGRAYEGFFKNVKKGANPGFPKFKSKRHNRDSFRFTSAGFSLKGKNLYLAKCKTPFKVFWSRDLSSNPSSVTISKTPTGKYFASFVCDYEPERKSGKGTLGVDVGLKVFAYTSANEGVANPKFLIQSMEKLAKAQRKLSKKKKGSANRKRARIKVAKLHEKISNQRKDFLHKLSSRLVNENQVLVLESLNVKGMTKNRKIAKGVSDVSWSTFKQQILYKIQETDKGQLVYADPYFPSTQLCSTCNKTPEKKVEWDDRWYDCGCGNSKDRDYNAALNLKKMAKTLLKYRPELKEVKALIAPKYEEFKLFPEYS